MAAAVAAVFAALVGIPVLRLRGHYFAIASLGVAEGMRELVINAPRLTGGGAGITIPALGPEASVHFPSPNGFYFAALAVAGLAVVVSAAVAGSRFGYGLRAIALDEAAAAAIGVRTTLFKVAAFSASAALTALAGGRSFPLCFRSEASRRGPGYPRPLVTRGFDGGAGSLRPLCLRAVIRLVDASPAAL